LLPFEIWPHFSPLSLKKATTGDIKHLLVDEGGAQVSCLGGCLTAAQVLRYPHHEQLLGVVDRNGHFRLRLHITCTCISLKDGMMQFTCCGTGGFMLISFIMYILDIVKDLNPIAGVSFYNFKLGAQGQQLKALSDKARLYDCTPLGHFKPRPKCCNTKKI